MGKLIVFEGTDGTGKSTQFALLTKRLQSENIPFRRLQFPQYLEPSSALIRMYLNGEFGDDPNDVNAYAASTFYAVDRYASYQRVWKDDYAAGGLILSDRYTTSNAVHQGGKLEGAAREEFFSWLYDLEFCRMGLPKPDLVLCLDMPVEIAETLMRKRESDTGTKADIHERDDEYLHQCREVARQAAAYFGWTRRLLREGREAPLDRGYPRGTVFVREKHVWRKHNTMVYIILGNGFEPMEAIAPCDILRRGGVEVQFRRDRRDADRGRPRRVACRPTAAWRIMKLASTDMVILPGGLGGVHSILACETAMNFIRLAYEDGKYYRGHLRRADDPRPAAHHRRPQGHLLSRAWRSKMGAAVMTACGAVQDGRVITGRAAGSADEFGLLCLQALKGKDRRGSGRGRHRLPRIREEHMAEQNPNARPDEQTPEDRTRWKKVWKSFRSTSCWRPSRTIWPASTR